MTKDSGDGRKRRGLFISYRRGDTNGQACALHDQLVRQFGADRVFMDVDSIAPGADFLEKIEEAIDSSGALLVLIGRDWMGRDGHSLDDPGDFVRLEIDTAINRNVPTIPILVERTPMPDPSALPESLRPLTRRNALELENGRWQFDVSRLVSAVEPLVDPSAGAGAAQTGYQMPPQRNEKGSRPERPRSARSRRSLAISAGVIAVVLALVIVLLGSSSSPPKRSVTPVSAATPVAKVPSTRLAEALLTSRFIPQSLPSGTSASSPVMSNIRYPGLVASVYDEIAGPAAGINVYYEVFDNSGDASAFFATSHDVSDHVNVIGPFDAPGVGDSVRCANGHEPAASSQAPLWESSCLMLSSDVGTFISVTNNSDNHITDDRLAATLAGDAIRQLAKVANSTSDTPVEPPPGSLAPDAQFEQILNQPFTVGWLPAGLSSPSVQEQDVGTGGPTGLISNSRIVATFNGSNSQDFLDFYVFDSGQDALTWFNPPPTPVGSTKTGAINSSGFSQQSACGEYVEPPANGATQEVNLSECDILWGNIVIAANVPSTSATQTESDYLAVNLARAGLIYVDAIDHA